MEEDTDTQAARPYGQSFICYILPKIEVSLPWLMQVYLACLQNVSVSGWFTGSLVLGTSIAATLGSVQVFAEKTGNQSRSIEKLIFTFLT